MNQLQIDNIILVHITEKIDNLYPGIYMKNNKDYWYLLLPSHGILKRVTNKHRCEILNNNLNNNKEQ